MIIDAKSLGRYVEKKKKNFFWETRNQIGVAYGGAEGPLMNLKKTSKKFGRGHGVYKHLLRVWIDILLMT